MDQNRLRHLALLDITMYTQFPLLFAVNPFGGAHAAAVLLKSTLMLILLFITLKELIHTKNLVLRPVRKTETMESRQPI